MKLPEVASRPPGDTGRRAPRPVQGGVLQLSDGATANYGGCPSPPAAPARSPAASRRQRQTPGHRTRHAAPPASTPGGGSAPTSGRRGRAGGERARHHMEARARPIGCGRASRGARWLRLVPELQRLHGPGVHVTLCLIPPATESCAAALVAAAAAARGAPAPPPRFEVAAAGGAAKAGSWAPRASAAPARPGAATARRR